MPWLLTSYGRRYHRHYQSSGQNWQRRFTAVPSQQDKDLLTVLRSIERHPLRTGLVGRVEA